MDITGENAQQKKDNRGRNEVTHRLPIVKVHTQHSPAIII